MDKAQKHKYSMIYYSIAVFHLVYIAIYLYTKCELLVIQNIISIVVYLILGYKADRVASIRKIFFACFIEILFFSVSSSILIGWNSGFMLYLLGIMPLLFYSIHMLKNMDYKLTFKYGVVILGTFYLTMFLCFWGKLQVYRVSAAIENILYFMNVTVAFITMIGFLLVFVFKVDTEKRELVEENEILENSANYDQLTSLLNRRLLDDYIEHRFRKARGNGLNFSLLMCDIDDFKKVNDTYGHECGDEILKNVAVVLKKQVREGDQIFRWGGEEILILLTEEGGYAKKVANRCREAVMNSPIEYMGQKLSVTVTIGGCSYYDGATKDSMIIKADDNLYKGKKNGKNQVVF